MSDTSFGDNTRPSLLVRVRDPHDNIAWNDFVTAYGGLIISWCRKRGLQPSDAEDVSQQVLAKLLHRLQSFEYSPERGRFRSYLSTLVRYAINDFLSERSVAGSGDTRVLELLNSAEARDEIETQWESIFDLEILGEALRRTRDRVEPRTWDCFVKTAIDGVDASAVAKELQLSLAAVYKSKSRVLDLIREEVTWLDSNEESATRVKSLLRSN